jgi:hypothetical protein
MRLGFLRIVGLVALLALPATAFAQFGMPLAGQWSGAYGSKQENRLLLNLDWNGKELTGLINPGPTAATVKTTTIDYSNPEAWKVKITAEGKDAAGKVVPITIDGTLENIGVYYKIFRGTWQQGAVKSPFVVTRN